MVRRFLRLPRLWHGLMRPTLGLSLMPEPAFAAASLPLFGEGLIETLEWSFDMGWGPTGLPTWVDGLLDDYAAAGELLGHGVSYSLLAGAATPHDRWWLQQLEREVDRRSYRHVSEHMGFVGAGSFTFAAPLPMPRCEAALAIGRSRLAAFAASSGLPVGLENLATSFGPADATEQGRFLDDLLDPVDGFVVLDLHNLWCQAHNLELDLDALLSGYPLDRVRELHVSGGSWDIRAEQRRTIRRDTHDGLVPTAVTNLLRRVLPLCPILEVVVYERLGTTLSDPASHEAFRDDVRRIHEIVATP